MVDLPVLGASYRQQLRQAARREGTCSEATKRSKGQGDGPQGIETPGKIRKLQIALDRKAKADPRWRFWSLYGEICRRDILEHALRLVARNGGAAGVDGQTIDSITARPENQQGWLEGLQQELQTKMYRPEPVRRVCIPKSSGGQRALGCSNGKRPRGAVGGIFVLIPIFEADFHPRSFGFRSRRNARQALDAIVEALRSGRTEVLDADLSIPRWPPAASPAPMARGSLPTRHSVSFLKLMNLFCYLINISLSARNWVANPGAVKASFIA